MRPEPVDRNEPGGLTDKAPAAANCANAALDLLLDWGRARMPELIEVRERRAQKLNEVLKAVEAYWTATAPCGEAFALEKGLDLLLYDLRRYQAALATIFEKERDHEALLKHQLTTRQDIEAAQQRWLACRDVTNAVRQVLDAGSPSGG